MSQYWGRVEQNTEVLKMYPFIAEELVHSGSQLSLANHRYVGRCSYVLWLWLRLLLTFRSLATRHHELSPLFGQGQVNLDWNCA